MFDEKTDRILSVKTLDGSRSFTIGDEVIHEGCEDGNSAVIIGFYWDDMQNEVRANTTKGHAGIDYLSHVPVKQSLEEDLLDINLIEYKPPIDMEHVQAHVKAHIKNVLKKHRMD